MFRTEILSACSVLGNSGVVEPGLGIVVQKNTTQTNELYAPL